MSAGGETFDGSAPGRETALARGERRWYVATAVVALLGLADSIYLTAQHFAGRNVRCMVVTGCDEVLQSRYSTVADTIPLAALGALAYFAVFSLATLAAYGYGGVRTLLNVTIGLMFAFTLWLLYLQAFVIKAFCTYCLLSAAVTTTLALLVLGRWFLHSRRRMP